LPGSPILPSYGLEQYGLPIVRRNAEAWRQFDVTGLVGTDYSGSVVDTGIDLNLDDCMVQKYTASLKTNGAWINDEDCNGRLVYINGRFVPSLSMVSNVARNLNGEDITDDALIECMNRLTDGFTDKLAADVPSGDSDFLTSMKRLSGPNHNVGEPSSQFAINNQQGTACFVALNSVRAGSVAFVNIPDDHKSGPILIVNAFTAHGGVERDATEQGVAIHPRCLVRAGNRSELRLIQTSVDLDDCNSDSAVPKFVNGVTQIYVGEGAHVTHSYLEECGGIVTPGVEQGSEDEVEGIESPRVTESKRKALKNTFFEMIDAHVTGDKGSYDATVMGFGGNGRCRIALSATLLRPESHAGVKGFTLSGGAQRTDMRTNIHHIAQGTTSSQSQKNMVGGRATNTFKGRIRVEQSAQQTDSAQIARTILMSDKARVYTIPSLEIIADDVQCTHGATVSDLSEEELFYLRSRGVDRTTARNLLMYGFVDEISSGIDVAVQGDKDDPNSLRNRVVKRLQNMVPKGEKVLVGDEFQSV
jgi:Fe-S cluster assembly scaffold protein SufB